MSIMTKSRSELIKRLFMNSKCSSSSFLSFFLSSVKKKKKERIPNADHSFQSIQYLLVVGSIE